MFYEFILLLFKMAWLFGNSYDQHRVVLGQSYFNAHGYDNRRAVIQSDWNENVTTSPINKQTKVSVGIMEDFLDFPELCNVLQLTKTEMVNNNQKKC